MKKTVITPFCEILNNNNILKTYSVLGVIGLLKNTLKNTKTDLLLYFATYTYDNDYIEFLINEIKRQDYLKDYGLETITPWLDKNNLTILQVEDLTVPIKLQEIIGIPLNYDEFIEDFDKKRLIQDSLLYYFLNKYANLLIDFLESKKTKVVVDSSSKISTKKISNSENIVNDFSKAINALREMEQKMNDEIALEFGDNHFFDHSPAEIKYEPELAQLVYNVKSHLKELYYSSNKDDYFYFDCSFKVYELHYEERKQAYLAKIIDSTEEDFINSEVKYLTTPYNNRMLYIDGWLNEDYSPFIEYTDEYRIPLTKKLTFLDQRLFPYNKSIEIKENTLLEDENGKYHFYGTDAKIKKGVKKRYEEKITDSPSDNPESEVKTEKQFTTNQIVLLLQEIGFFTHPKIENASKEKQSVLISKICGFNSKNIKNHIEKLDKDAKTLGLNHKKDIEKIDDIVNNLE